MDANQPPEMLQSADDAKQDALVKAAQELAADEQPDRPVWFWTAQGTHLLWANEAGLSALGLKSAELSETHHVAPTSPARRSLRSVARTPIGLGGRGRIEILRINAAGHQETLVATCKPVYLNDELAVMALGTMASRARTPVVPVADLTPTQPVQTEPVEPGDIASTTTLPETNLSTDPDRVEPGSVAPPDDAMTMDDTVGDDMGGQISGENDVHTEREAETVLPPTSPADETVMEDNAAQPQFQFKPRSRPHRFSFVVDPQGSITELSSGLQDAVGPSTCLCNGEAALAALRARLGSLEPAIENAIAHGHRFSEHTALWPVSDDDRVVPVRLTGYDEDDGSLRIFGTALTGQAQVQADDIDAADLTEDGESTSHTDSQSSSARDDMSAIAANTASDNLADAPLDVPALSTEHAEIAGLYAEQGPTKLDDLPDDPAKPDDEDTLKDHQTLSEHEAIVAGLYAEDPAPAALPEQTSTAEDTSTLSSATAAQIPGGAAVVAAATALAQGFVQGLAQDLSTPEVSDATQQSDSSEETSSPLPEPQTLSLEDASVAGLWAAHEIQDTSAFAADVEEELQDDTDVVAEEDVPSPTAEPTSPPPAVDDDRLSRPERLTFQEIARRLGARITERDGPGNDTTARLTDDEAEPAPGRPDDRLADGATLVRLETPETEPTTLSASPLEPSEGVGPEQEHQGGQVLPFTRTEPNAERMVLDRLPLGIIIYAHNTVLYANRAAFDLMGVQSLQALQAHDPVAALLADDPEDGSNTTVLTRPDGSKLPVDGRLQSVRWDGQSAVLLSLQEHESALSANAPSVSDERTQGDDDTAQRTALPLVRARIGELEAIVDLATDGVITLDGEGEIKDLNQAAQALIGYSDDDLIGRPFRLIFTEDSRQIALDYLEEIASQGHLSLFNEGRELECLAAQGGVVPVFMTLGLLTDHQPPTFCAVLRDLSPYKQAETDLVAARQAAEEANAHKSDFLARVSHEIRTPLNAVIGFSEVMLEERFGPVGSERYRQYLRDIHTSGEHLMSLLNDLLDLSKIEAGKMDMTFGEVDLNDVVQQCLAIMQPQANQGRIIVRTSLPLTVPHVVSDLRSIRQIVLNLMSNAIKFTDPGGQIIVSTLYEPTGEVSLRVRDTGRGMSQADVELAMEPFRQVPTTLSQVISGTGLGLPLTKALVEANRAHFALESNPGEGTLAKVTFPLQRVLAE